MAIIDNNIMNKGLITKMPSSLKKHKIKSQKPMISKKSMRRAVSIDAVLTLFHLAEGDRVTYSSTTSNNQAFHTKKNVSFNPMTTIYEVLRPDKDEISRRWYNVTDYRIFDATRKNDLSIIQWSITNSQKLHPDYHTTIGLEKYASITKFYERKNHMMRHRYAILHAQSYQKYKNMQESKSLLKHQQQMNDVRSISHQEPITFTFNNIDFEKNQYDSSWRQHFHSNEIEANSHIQAH